MINSKLSSIEWGHSQVSLSCFFFIQRQQINSCALHSENFHWSWDCTCICIYKVTCAVLHYISLKLLHCICIYVEKKHETHFFMSTGSYKYWTLFVFIGEILNLYSVLLHTLYVDWEYNILFLWIRCKCNCHMILNILNNFWNFFQDLPTFWKPAKRNLYFNRIF